MLRLRICVLASAAAMAAAPVPAIAQSPGVVGTWSGSVVQPGHRGYSLVMTLTESGGTTNYPELSCGGRLIRAGAAGEYVFFTETITRGRLDAGGRCIDGTITVARAGANLAWGWFGSFRGKAMTASAMLARK